MIVRCIFAGIQARARLLIDTFTTDRRFEAVALVDESVDLCRQAIADNSWQALPCFTDLDEAIRTVEADAVVIVGAAASRPLQVRQALKMGRHVYVANPISESLEAARDLVDFAEHQRVTIVVDAPRRYGVTERTMAGWAREGRHGALQAASFRIDNNADRPWERGARDLGLLLPVLGWGVQSVEAGIWLEEQVCGTLVLADGRTCRYEGGAADPSSELRFDFDRASVRAVGGDERDKRLELSEPPAGFHPVDIRDGDDPDPGERFSKESFYRAVTQRVRVADDGREHLLTLAVVEAIRRAAECGTGAAVRRT